ncbi:hypothetical protein [Marinobacter sp. ELB17]|uniref:hypothetical protein n=1 Tax=Marinobacter sp. ELB17 TaxID=270374 RepID=UPI0012F49BF1|nr:hypothetical protein [Marinobacter sp. ELB17]
MRSGKSALLAGALLSVSLLSGCASTGITEYHDDHSRAWNLTHSVGMTKLKDSTVPRDQIPSAILNTLDTGIDVFYFMDSQTLSMDFGNALGLGLIGMISRPKSHSERSSIVAWIPQEDVNSRDVAHLWLGDQLRDATTKAMETLKIEGEVEFHNREKKVLFSEAYYETKITGIKKDGTKCGAYIRTYSDIISELKPLPDFLAQDTEGYQVYAGDDTNYPRFQVYCFSDSLEQYVEFTTEISKSLPETVFLYTRLIKYDDNHVPPMVYDHGKALFFLVEKD